MNIPTFIIAAVIAAAVVAVIVVGIRNKKNSKCSCGGDCSSCNACRSKK